MTERNNVTTFQGNPLTLVGDELAVGQQAPDCQMLDAQLNPVNLSSYKGKVCIVCSVPSLDTPVCDSFHIEGASLFQPSEIIAAWVLVIIRPWRPLVKPVLNVRGRCG